MNKTLTSALLLTLGVSVGNAQKLPNIQTANVRAPEKVTVDGRLGEWGAQLQAHNNATDIYYTIANDDSHLYLVMHVTNPDVINKALRGGITCYIQPSGKRDDKGAVGISYPAPGMAMAVIIKQRPGTPVDTTIATAAKWMEKSNNTIGQKFKSIGVTGIKGIDSALSVYNDNDIKAAGLFDIKKTYTVELSLPFKYLDPSISNGSKFTYHIVLNGYKTRSNIVNNMDGTAATNPEALRVQAAMDQMDAAISSRTDFWGEYTLAKK